MIEFIITNFYKFNHFQVKTIEDRSIIFFQNNTYYLFEVYDSNYVTYLYNLTKNFSYYSFVFNYNNSIITNYHDKMYVLLHDYYRLNFSFSHLMNFQNTNQKIQLTWRDKWIYKSDYVEQYYSSIKGRYPIIDESIEYYLGLLELSIYYLCDLGEYRGYGCLQHMFFNVDDYFNPLNVVVDFKERDFAEYLKYLFFSKNVGSDEVSELIFSVRDVFNFQLVIARLIYPNYYFDLFDQIILNKQDSKVLYKIISRVEEYNQYIQKIIDTIIPFQDIKKISLL